MVLRGASPSQPLALLRLVLLASRQRHVLGQRHHSVALSSILGLTSPSSHKKPPLSCTCVEPILQPFCFHIHTWEWGYSAPPLYTKKRKELMSTTIWCDLGIPARSSNCENTNGNKCLRRPS